MHLIYTLQDYRVYTVLRNGVVVVGVTDGSGSHVTLDGQDLISLGQWNYLLIQLE